MQVRTQPRAPSQAEPEAQPQVLVREMSLVLVGDFQDNDRVWTVLCQVVREAGCTVEEEVPHPFTPQGFSGALILAESHVTIHTWPERNRAVVQASTCGERPLNEGVLAGLSQFWKVIVRPEWVHTLTDADIPEP